MANSNLGASGEGRRDRVRAVIFGLSGPSLTDDERRFFEEADPLGFILFTRNCEDRGQAGRLVEELRAIVGRDDAPVLIDQEGGRVARLRPPQWRAAPPALRFAEAARERSASAVEAAYWNARLIAADLAELGITVDCAPVLDVPQPDAHCVIGDRAAGDTPELATLLGRAWCEGLLAGGVLPVIKHLPGHGRARADSHVSLPRVDADRTELERVDLLPFRALREMPWAMTAHVVYESLDPASPATTSSKTIAEVIRQWIGFDGVLVSDDICMGALGGGLGGAPGCPVGERARLALEAGCDVVLHCNGVREEMEAVAAACGPLTAVARERVGRAEAMRRAPEPFDRADAIARIDAVLEATSHSPCPNP